MAQFRAVIKGNRESVSRLGSKNSGIEADVNGWNSGIRVIGRTDENDKDVFEVFATSGSNRNTSPLPVGFLSFNESGDVIYTPIVKGRKKL